MRVQNIISTQNEQPCTIYRTNRHQNAKEGAGSPLSFITESLSSIPLFRLCYTK